MRFLLCILLPPVGVLTIRPGSFWLCLLLTVVGLYFVGVVYALIMWTKRNEHFSTQPTVIVNNYTNAPDRIT